MTQEAAQSVEVCDIIYKIYYFYIERILNLLGLLLNTLNIIVYIKLIGSRKACGDMYKYLLFKSFIDAYYSLRNLIFVLFDYPKIFGLQRYRFAVYLYWIFIIYGGESAQLMSIWCEFGACFSRFRKVSKNFVPRGSFKRYGIYPTMADRFRIRLNYIVVLTAIFVLSLLAYSYRLFEHEVITKPDREQSAKSSSATNTTSVMYVLIYNSFGASDTVIILDFLNSFLMNCVSVIGILVLNILALIKTRKCLDRKRALTTTTIVSRRPSHFLPNGCAAKDLTVRSRMKISKAEMNISLMVFTSGLIAVLGNGFIFLYRLPFMAYSGNFCIYSIANFAFCLSYVMNFFIYFGFHKKFRKCFCTLFGSFGKFVFRGTLDAKSNSNTHTHTHTHTPVAL